jgi:hypothetical protein
VVGSRHHALNQRGVWSASARVKLVVQQALVDLVGDVDQRLPVLVGEKPADAEAVAVVDGRLSSWRGPL